MIVVSDTSCITNLITIGQDRLLADLFGSVLIPPAVNRELLRGHATIPPYVSVRSPEPSPQLEQLSQELDQGEAEAICLAKELRAERLLMDESAGRAAARRMGVPEMGLLGVLLPRQKPRLGERSEAVDSAATG